MSYDPTIGRFISEDPIAFDGGDADLYRYVGNSPTNFTDPSGLQAPTSITLTPPGRTPVVTTNPPKSNQSDRPGPNTNPWLSRGGPNQKTGQRFYKTVTLEYVITFDGTPCKGQWGRRVWSNSFYGDNFSVDRIGRVWLYNSGTDDTDPQNDYVLGNNVYMYDAPGMAYGSSSFIFEVWAKSCDGKTSMSKWFYVNSGKGTSYEIAAPGYSGPPRRPIPGWNRYGGISLY
jgi:uncharacterized protein RhaS with RHS repeats